MGGGISAANPEGAALETLLREENALLRGKLAAASKDGRMDQAGDVNTEGGGKAPVAREDGEPVRTSFSSGDTALFSGLNILCAPAFVCGTLYRNLSDSPVFSWHCISRRGLGIGENMYSTNTEEWGDGGFFCVVWVRGENRAFEPGLSCYDGAICWLLGLVS